MRRPALSGPESEISREWAEYVVRQASGRNTVTGEFGIPRAPLAFPPLDVGTATPPSRFYAQIQPKPILSLAPVLSLPSRRPSEMGHAPSAFGAVCYCKKKMRTSIGSRSALTHPIVLLLL